jgi:1-acyl-sn-glycerol-3-phosphate acyltransferase
MITGSTLWSPRSGCGPECLSGDERPGVGMLRAGARLMALLGVLLAAAVTMPVLRLARPARRQVMVRAIARGILRTLGVRRSMRGRLPVGRALVVANHVSWLDTVVILAAARTRLVAKKEVGAWPLIGTMARYSGALFIDRNRPMALPVVLSEVREALAAGDVVVVFPEATTSCGTGCGKGVPGFRPAFFQAAIDARAAVVPLSLAFRTDLGPTAAPAFIGEETLVTSLRRVLFTRGLRVALSAGAALHPDRDASRRMLARVATRAVRCEWPVPTPTPAPATPVAASRPTRTSSRTLSVTAGQTAPTGPRRVPVDAGQTAPTDSRTLPVAA